MRLSARNQVLSLTLQFLVYASDRTTGTKWLLSPKTSYLHSRQKQWREQKTEVFQRPGFSILGGGPPLKFQPMFCWPALAAEAKNSSFIFQSLHTEKGRGWGRREQSANNKTGHRLWTKIQAPRKKLRTSIPTAPFFCQKPIALCNSDLFSQPPNPAQIWHFLCKYTGRVRVEEKQGNPFR